MTALQSDADAFEAAKAALTQTRSSVSEPVLIAGGGIGGLAAALALAKRGITSHVVERRTEFEPEGAGIQIGPNGTRILQRLGVAEALRPHAGVPQCICVRDGLSGRVLTRLPLGAWIEERHGAPYWVAHRRDLHGVLRQAVHEEPRVSLQMGFAATAASADNNGAAVAAANGQTYTGQALIAADGIWSGLRESVFHSPPPQYAGKSAARSVVAMDDVPAGLTQPEVSIWLFARAHVVHYPVSGGAELAMVVIAEDTDGTQDWSAPVDPSWVHMRLPAGADELLQLAAKAPTWRKWALQTMVMPAEWTQGRIALLGDAAHPVFPFLAQGGVLALEDAAVIAAMLEVGRSDVAGALARYARRRRPRAARVAEASRQNGRIYHFSGALAHARNAALHLVPPERLMARYDWLYGWRED